MTTSHQENVEGGEFEPSDRRPQTIPEFIRQIQETAEKLIRDEAPRGDVKLLCTALKELRYSFKVFRQYRQRRKITVFGSARIPPSDPSYQQAIEFGRRAAEEGFMLITGAGNGIMEAGHMGAGRANSLGLNIMLPFEQSANQVIRGDEKLISHRYFFTRKLMFVKETDGVVLFPGGFGTMDEAFEVLTLVQTGKTHLFPIVCVDVPGGTFWKNWQRFIEAELLAKRLISAEDLGLYKITESVEDALAEIKDFHRVYHSMRYVKGNLVFRLQEPISEALLGEIRKEFADIVVKGTFEPCGPDPTEANDPETLHLPRIRFRFDRRSAGRLRMLIDRLNRG
jgi:uncharacterized protein (TIGR00730 family)